MLSLRQELPWQPPERRCIRLRFFEVLPGTPLAVGTADPACASFLYIPSVIDRVAWLLHRDRAACSRSRQARGREAASIANKTAMAPALIPPQRTATRFLCA